MIDNSVRSKPFADACLIMGNEREMVLECLDSQRWSSFKGATEGWDIHEVGSMLSAQAAKYGALDNRFLGGKYVRDFEALFAEMWSVDFAVSANSATSCLVMAMGSINLNPGDEVIVPCMSFNATATAILSYNAIPVFCEVKEDTFCIDPCDIESRITDKTRAILVVHLGGNAADMDLIMTIANKHNLKVVEDVAQSPGVKHKGKLLGTFGDCGIFSFTETKNITCGEGGMLITNNDNIAFKSRLIRNHGEGVVGVEWDDDDLVNVIGMNFRLTEIQAAIAIPQLKSLAERNVIRQQNTQYLKEKLAKYTSLIFPVVEVETDYVCFMLKLRWIPKSGEPSRDDLVEALQNEGIPVTKGYGHLMHENPIFVRKIAYGSQHYPFVKPYFDEAIQYGSGSLPRSEEINKQFIWFKFINPPNTIKDMDDVVTAFEKVLEKTVL